MIPILYAETEKEFESNGIGALTDIISCVVTEERNGGYEAEIKYPAAGQFFSEIKLSRYVTAKPNAADMSQPFQIYKISKPINGKVTINARHNRYRMNFIPVAPFAASDASDAFGKLKENAAEYCPFNFSTNLGSGASFKLLQPYTMSQILGGIEGSILDTYGGEYYFDKFNVKLLANRGKDKGVIIRYGKNLTDLTQDETIENTITGIYPYWKNTDGDYLELPEKIISSENEKYFPYPRTIPKDFSDEFQEMPSVEQLREVSQKYVKDNKIGTPSVTLKVSYIQLEQTQEYKHMRALEGVSLCDYVTVEFEKLGVLAKAKVIKTRYDSLKEKYESLEIGDAKTNLATTIIEQKEELEKRPSNSVVNKYIESATQLITGNKGGYIVFKLNEEKKPYEFLIMDNEDIKKARNIWRFNLSGFGHSSTGYEGPYPLAITQDGKIVADFITAGTMLADRIRAGKLQSQDYVEGKSGFELDLDKGIINFYGSDDSGNASKLVFDKGGITISNLADGSTGKVSIRYQKIGDDYYPIISGTDGETGYSMNQNALIYMIGTVFKSSIGVSGNKGYVATDELTVRESIKTGGGEGLTQKITLPGGAFLQFHSGVCVGGKSAVDGKTGRAEFSDNSWMHFTGGVVDSGHTTEGGNL